MFNILKMDKSYKKDIWGTKDDNKFIPSQLCMLFNTCNALFKKGIPTGSIDTFFLKNLKSLQHNLQTNDDKFVNFEDNTVSVFDITDYERNESVVRNCVDTYDCALIETEQQTCDETILLQNCLNPGAKLFTPITPITPITRDLTPFKF